MKPQDRETFATMLDGLSQVYGNKLGLEGMSIWWGALVEYSIEQVREALSEHVKDASVGKFAPKPSDVIGKIQQHDGHPGPEEAWALVAAALTDEGVTVVMTGQIAKAFGVALMLNDDPIAARMAFKEAYGRALSQARADGDRPVWFPSLGRNASGREGPLKDAVRLGRIDEVQANKLLPHQPLPAVEGLEVKRIESKGAT